MGYHTYKIQKGELGEFSKIVEEFQELEDAHLQGCKILELVELSDLLGAIDIYLQNKYNLSWKDISHMASLTRKAFESGDRSNK